MMSVKFILLFALVAVAHCRVRLNPLYRYLDEVAKRDPGSCKHHCVPSCYDSSCGSYNQRSGTCSKAGYSCCEWVSWCKKDEAQDPAAYDYPGNLN